MICTLQYVHLQRAGLKKTGHDWHTIHGTQHTSVIQHIDHVYVVYSAYTLRILLLEGTTIIANFSGVYFSTNHLQTGAYVIYTTCVNMGNSCH